MYLVFTSAHTHTHTHTIHLFEIVFVSARDLFFFSSFLLHLPTHTHTNLTLQSRVCVCVTPDGLSVVRSSKPQKKREREEPKECGLKRSGQVREVARRVFFFFSCPLFLFYLYLLVFIIFFLLAPSILFFFFFFFSLCSGGFVMHPAFDSAGRFSPHQEKEEA